MAGPFENAISAPIATLADSTQSPNSCCVSPDATNFSAAMLATYASSAMYSRRPWWRLLQEFCYPASSSAHCRLRNRHRSASASSLAFWHCHCRHRRHCDDYLTCFSARFASRSSSTLDTLASKSPSSTCQRTPYSNWRCCDILCAAARYLGRPRSSTG